MTARQCEFGDPFEPHDFFPEISIIARERFVELYLRGGEDAVRRHAPAWGIRPERAASFLGAYGQALRRRVLMQKGAAP